MKMRPAATLTPLGSLKRAARGGARVELLDLVVVGVGDGEKTRVPDDPERVLEAHVRRADAVPVAELEEPLADDRPDGPARPRLDHADRARLAVGDVEELAVGGEAARLVHRRRLARAVLERLAAGAGVRPDLAAPGSHRPELVGARHGDVERALEEDQIPG